MDVSTIEKLPERIEKALAELLRTGETVHIKIKGAFKEGLVCTDSRVIILKGGFMTGQMFGTSTFQQPYSNIAGVQVKFSLLTGYFELSAGGMQNTAKSFWSENPSTDPAKAPNSISINSKAMAQKFRDAGAFILERSEVARTGRAPPAAPADGKDAVLSALERLAKLREGGALSDAEFEEKKRELLARL